MSIVNLKVTAKLPPQRKRRRTNQELLQSLAVNCSLLDYSSTHSMLKVAGERERVHTVTNINTMENLCEDVVKQKAVLLAGAQ